MGSDFMRKHQMRTILLMILSVFCLHACSITYTISDAATKSYKKEVMKIGDVKNVAVRFTRPEVSIEVTVSDSIPQTEMEHILALTKAYVTVENMDRVAKSVNWNSKITRVHLRFVSDKKKEILKTYATEYFKSYDTTDLSPENIDEYKTWREEKASW